MESKNIALDIIDEILYHLSKLQQSIVRYMYEVPYSETEEEPKPLLPSQEEEGEYYTLEDLGLSANPLDDFKEAKEAINVLSTKLNEKGYASSGNKNFYLLQEYLQTIKQSEELLERCDDFLNQLPLLNRYSKTGNKELNKHCDLILASKERLEADCSFLTDSITSE